MDVRVVLAMVAVLVAGCGGTSKVRPTAPALETVGVLATVKEFDDRTEYSLTDGITWSRPKSAFRLVYDFPAGSTLFVSGTDAAGTFVYLIGRQEGLAADCQHALRYGGSDWGDSIEAQGLLWTKAPDFTGLPEAPSGTGWAYPDSVGFCLDDQARVTSVYVASPPTGTPQPAGSGRS
jgi:hypothetical protein